VIIAAAKVAVPFRERKSLRHSRLKIKENHINVPIARRAAHAAIVCDGTDH
jgi:hypothetical protein